MNLNDLPEQFPNPTAGFTPMQQKWYAGLQAGAGIDPTAMQSKSYAEVVAVFRSLQGEVAGESYWQMQLRHKRERNQCLASGDTPAERVSNAEVSEYIGKGLDDIAAGKRPNVTGYMRDRGCTARHIRAVQQRDTTRSNTAALEQHKQHHVLQLIAEHGKATDMNKGTVTRSLRKVGEQYTLAQRVAALEERAERVERLLEARLTIIESGQHWHDVARGMRAGGQGPTAIAQATGQALNTVKQFLKRDRGV